MLLALGLLANPDASGSADTSLSMRSWLGSRYFANTTQRNKNSFDFTMNWAKSDNTLIKDLKDFTATFFQKHTLLNVLLNYSVFDVSDTLLVMRPHVPHGL